MGKFFEVMTENYNIGKIKVKQAGSSSKCNTK
jgi:hypothetical protein